ncbi:MAG TPA: DUF1552 domain-containing protein [Polyangia bacterium]|jgi:hypothetical protein
MTFTRRNLLRALGLGGTAAYFAPRDRAARAAAAAIPTRILFFYTPHGSLFRQWVRPPAGATAASETAFELGPTLMPLAAFKNKLLLLEGLDMQSQYVDGISPMNGHVGGQTHALSAISRANNAAAGGISIDQFIAKSINMPTPVTPLPSLELSARSNAANAPFVTSWAGSNALVPPITSPTAAYTRLFPQGPPSAQPDPGAARAAMRRKSILDATLAEFSAVSVPLAANDRAKLDSHAALIRDLEVRVQLMGNTTNCSAPDQATVTGPYAKDCPKAIGAPCLTDSMDAFIQLSVAALACDLTRVITLDMEQFPSALFGVDDIHAFLHSMDDVFWYANDRWGTKTVIPATTMDPKNIQIAVSFYAMYATRLATLLGTLDAVKETDGSTLLDHTLVVWCGEIGSTNHTNFMINYLIAGGGAVLKTGRYLSLPRTSPTKVPGDYYPNAGLPHNNLFVSLANAMGLSGVTTFGNPAVCTGPLANLTG